MDNMGAIQEIFIKESSEILDNLESDLLQLEEEWQDELINQTFRHMHTLKGSSGIAGFQGISEFTHRLENLLDLVRSGKLSAGKKHIDLLLDSVDWLREALTDSEGNGDDEWKKKLLERADELMEQGGAGEEAEQDEETGKAKEVGYRYFRIRAHFREDIFERGIDPLMIMEDLSIQGTIIERKIAKGKLPAYGELDPEKCYMGWDFILKTKQAQQAIDEVFLFVEDDNDVEVRDVTEEYTGGEESGEYLEERRIGEILVARGILTEPELNDVLSAQDGKNRKLGDLVVEKGYATEKDVQYALGEQEKVKKKLETSTVRVDTGKLDNLLNLLGEIVIGQSAILRIADELDEGTSFRLKNALYGLDRSTREFQEQIMAIRMIPIGPSFEKFRRFVRDTAHGMGKEIRLEIEGGETELDKTVIEQIDDPLKHMIRNAVDHGIENAEERGEAGKDRTGTVILRAHHQEGYVIIEVIDDGRGLDRAKIRKKGEALGYIQPGEEINEQRVLSMLFMPGFSTAEKVGDLSGRGVGMDVVKTNIESLRGSVEIETTEGKGTTFRVKLPLTLAIIEGMLVRVGEDVYIVPLLSIVESVQPEQESIRTVKEKGEVIQVRNEYVPLMRLYELFEVKPDHEHPWESMVVVVESGVTRVGMMIDELLGQQQIVIKSIENYITQSRAISGAAILGDGRVALIIDVHGLIEEIGK